MPTELSGGEQQRVALARALVNNAKIIIADEPTGNIDPEMSYEIVDLLDHINATGTTVVMVTHEHSLVKQFNHRVIKIERLDEFMDVYDVTVPLYHNFPIDLGDNSCVFVHNCVAVHAEQNAGGKAEHVLL